jgi:hypothetical protein
VEEVRLKLRRGSKEESKEWGGKIRCTESQKMKSWAQGHRQWQGVQRGDWVVVFLERKELWWGVEGKMELQEDGAGRGLQGGVTGGERDRGKRCSNDSLVRWWSWIWRSSEARGYQGWAKAKTRDTYRKTC